MNGRGSPPAVFACLLVAGGCGGDGGGDPAPRAAPGDRSPARTPAPGLGRSDEAEVEALVTDAVGRHARVRCRVVGRPGPGTSRFSCTARDGRYRVDWEHYGTGRYVIHVVDRAGRLRRVEQGTLSIGE